jgi:hypothetical protein
MAEKELGIAWPEAARGALAADRGLEFFVMIFGMGVENCGGDETPVECGRRFYR